MMSKRLHFFDSPVFFLATPFPPEALGKLSVQASQVTSKPLYTGGKKFHFQANRIEAR
jgi:hypothetical protein